MAALPSGGSLSITKNEVKTDGGFLRIYGCEGGGPDTFVHKLGSWGIIVASGFGVSADDVASALEAQVGMKLSKLVTTHTTSGKVDVRTTWKYEHKYKRVDGYVILASQGSTKIGDMPGGAIGRFYAEIPISDTADSNEVECPKPPEVPDYGPTPTPDPGLVLADAQLTLPPSMTITRGESRFSAEFVRSFIGAAVGQLPPQAKEFMANQRIDVVVDQTNTGTQRLRVTFDGSGSVAGVGASGENEPTGYGKTTERAFESSLDSSDERNAILIALRDGTIALSFSDPVKQAAVNAALKNALPAPQPIVCATCSFKYGGQTVRFNTAPNGLLYTSLIGTHAPTFAYFNQWGAPMGYTGVPVHQLGTAGLSSSAGMYTLPNGEMVFGINSDINARLTSTQTTGRNFFIDLIDHGRTNGGMLHDSNLYIGPPPGGYTGPPAGAYVGPPIGAYTGPPVGAYTGLYTPPRR